MKVLLLRPWGTTDEIIPPIGLGYLASSIIANNEVRIVDCLKDKIFPENLGPILAWCPDVVGISLFSKDLLITQKYLAQIKKFSNKIITVIGGPHPSGSAEKIFELFTRNLDYAFAGEAEAGFPLLLKDLSEGNNGSSFERIPGLIWLENGSLKQNEKAFPKEINKFSCAWDLIRPDSYPPLPHGAFYKAFPIAPVIITRGCPHRCTFCTVGMISGRQRRIRSISNVLNELELLKAEYGVREIHIEDDNFTADTSYVQEFCRQLISKRLSLSWTCPNGVRLDTLDEPTLRLMKEAGCYVISVGIESGSNRILKLMKKNLSISQIKEKVNLIHQIGITVSGFFIIGYPGETIEEIRQTFAFSRSLPLSRVTYSFVQPFPGSEIAKMFPPTDFLHQDLHLHRAHYLPKGISEKKLRRMRRRALLCFYLRPSIMWDMIKNIRSYDHLVGIIKRMIRWLKA